MKKFTSMLVMAGTLWVSGLTGHAIPYSDYDEVFSWVTTSRSGNFDIVNGDGGLLDVSGFNPNFESIISATASFTFLDTDGNANTVSVFLGESFFLSDTVTASLVSKGGSLEGSALLNLNEDGVITYTVQNSNPSDPFIFLQAFLSVESGPKSIAPVPDGGNTVGLLGLGLLGLFGMGRCFRRLKTAS
jgi:hypothetical protein